jgi:hypothetical protein
VYDGETGVQKCPHHDPCTPEFLNWEKDRFEDLSCRVGAVIPKSKLPLWESVSALRMECVMRAENAAERAALIQKTTKAQLEKWLLENVGVSELFDCVSVPFRFRFKCTIL